MSGERNIQDVLIDDGLRGIVKNVPTDEHHARRRMNPSSLCAGMLSHHEIDPALIRHAWSGHREFGAAAQDRMDRGTLAGILLMQPERLANEVAIWDGSQRRGAEWDSFEEENQSKLIVKRADFNTVAEACRQLRFRPEVGSLLNDIDVEVEILTQEGRIFCSGQVDAITRGKVRKIIDLKTTDAGIDEQAVRRTIRAMHYREKMAAYKTWYERESGEEVVACFNLFVKLTPPLAVHVVKFTTSALQWGYSRILAALESVDQCLTRDEWPIYSAEMIADVDEWELEDVELEAVV